MQLPNDLTADFFYDERTAGTIAVDARKVEKAKGFKIFLGANDLELQTGLLLDGVAIDFLFEDITKKEDRERRVNAVKELIRSLEPDQQRSVVHFYLTLFTEIIDCSNAYKRQPAIFYPTSCCGIWCCSFRRNSMHVAVREAFQPTYKAIYRIL